MIKEKEEKKKITNKKYKTNNTKQNGGKNDASILKIKLHLTF